MKGGDALDLKASCTPALDFEEHCAEVSFTKVMLVTTTFDPRALGYEEDEPTLPVPLASVQNFRSNLRKDMDWPRILCKCLPGDS